MFLQFEMSDGKQVLINPDEIAFVKQETFLLGKKEIPGAFIMLKNEQSIPVKVSNFADFLPLLNSPHKCLG